jgi:hypothetical protein
LDLASFIFSLAEIGFYLVQETKIALGRQAYKYEIGWFYYSIKMLFNLNIDL